MMINKMIFIVVGIVFMSLDAFGQNDFTTIFENDNNATATYHEAIDYYKRLAASSDLISIAETGMTDSGFPLHEIVLARGNDFDSESSRASGKVIMMVNNAIHPGESCGVDASMMMARDIVTKNQNILDHMTIIIIPIYNIGGSLNRNSTTRANQNGPKAYGFRGNAKNLDLNRDFIKTDSENGKTFNHIFTKWNPDILIDNHTSNGADYQYVMTLIPTQKDKMNAGLSRLMTEDMLPSLFSKMEKKGYQMTPYVYVRNTPDEGIAGFLDYPRYSSGYASLFNTISFMPETHMLKPYKDRVRSTYLFMESMTEYITSEKNNILSTRAKAIEETKSMQTVALDWSIDRSQVDTVTFKGYTAKYKPSEVSGQDRLYYDHNDPYEKKIPHFNTYSQSVESDKPNAYILPRAYKQIVDKMRRNGVLVEELTKDGVYNVEIYRIEKFDSPQSPYEGHYIHRKTEVSKKLESINYFKGDYIIYCNQPANKYIVSTLEPHAPDSWFSWNFFDGILMQKEHFSSYVFEDLAAEYLENDPELKALLDKKKSEDADFAKDGNAQLRFVYEHSPHYEKTYKRYPVGRLLEK